MAWYDTGTVSVTNGSTAVVGSGTDFISAKVQVGEAFYGPDGKIYEIAAIVSSTSLTLADNYLGTTQSGQTYKIVPTQSLVADLATNVSTLITDFANVRDLAGEGKFDDGTVAAPGITFNLDQDNGLYRIGANNWAMAVGGSKIVDLTSTGFSVTGNVGIGTASPNTPLQVSGANSSTNADALFSVQKTTEGYGLFSGVLATGVSWLQGGTSDDVTYYNLALQPNGGNVGIGTASPAELLHIESGTNGEQVDIRFRGLTTSAGAGRSANIGFDPDPNDTGTSSEAQLYLSADTTNKTLVATAAGNVGIGTASPSSELHVKGADETQVYIEAPAGSNAGIRLLEDGTSKWTIGNDESNDGLFFYDFTAAAERMRIDSNGNLLVGTTDTTPWDNSTATAADDGIFLGGGRLGLAKWGGVPLLVNRTDSDGEIAIFYKDGAPVGSIGVAGSRPYLANNVNFGIKLDDFDGGQLQPATAAGAVQDDECSLGNSNIRWKDLYLSAAVRWHVSGVQKAYMQYDGTDVVHYGASGVGHQFWSGGNRSVDIDNSGNLLVKTPTPTTSLTVNGQGAFGSEDASGNGIYLYVSGALADNSYMSRNSAGTGTTTWYIGNQSITTSSDVRLKDNIVDSERNAVEIINNLRVVDHTWNDPSDQSVNNKNSRGVWTGLIAQEAVEHIPWLVNRPLEDVDENGHENYWHMDYGYAVPLLIKAIQEQQDLIESLTARIAALEGAN